VKLSTDADAGAGKTTTTESRFIHPSEFHFCQSPGQIQTILGSCIAITLWHPRRKIGGMCHFILPGRSGRNKNTSASRKLDGRYAEDAIMLFDKEASRHQTRLSEYQAKIFGGSNMLVSPKRADKEMVGLRNIEAALKHLYEKNIPLLFAHVGETGSRRIKFDVNNGDVWVKHKPL